MYMYMYWNWDWDWDWCWCWYWCGTVPMYSTLSIVRLYQILYRARPAAGTGTVYWDWNWDW